MGTHAELLNAFMLLACTWGPALAVYVMRRDLYDPRVVFLGVYGLATVGPVFYRYVYVGEHHSGMKVECLPAALFLCSTAALGFLFGATLALRKLPRQPALGTGLNTSWSLPTAIAARNVLVCLSVMILMLYAYYGYCVRAAMPYSDAPKALYKFYADEGDLRNFRFYGALAVVLGIYLVVVDAFARRHWFSLPVFVVASLHMLTCFASGERDILFVIVVWMSVNRQHLSRGMFLTAVAGTVMWLGLIGVTRTGGLGLTSQLDSFEQVTFQEWLRIVCHLSTNLHVLANVMYYVPADEPFWGGRSLAGAFASFIPGSFALKDETPSRWFADIYDHQGTAGVAFSQDAEAYLNFGPLGPVLWFAVGGYLLGLAYKRANTPGAGPLATFVWWYSLVAGLFSIRADSRALIKMVVASAIICKLLWYFAQFFAGSTPAAARSSTTPRRTTPDARSLSHNSLGI